MKIKKELKPTLIVINHKRPQNTIIRRDNPQTVDYINFTQSPHKNKRIEDARQKLEDIKGTETTRKHIRKMLHHYSARALDPFDS